MDYDHDFDEGVGRIQISKFADREDARPGDIVTFGIRIENVGDGAVTEVMVVDNSPLARVCRR